MWNLSTSAIGRNLKSHGNTTITINKHIIVYKNQLGSDLQGFYFELNALSLNTLHRIMIKLHIFS